MAKKGENISGYIMKKDREEQDMDFFWKKKTIVTYILSVLIFFIHISSFANYSEYPLWENVLRSIFSEILSPIAVPLFFIISGTLFFRDYENSLYIKKIRNRIKTLFVPYCLWNTLSMVFIMVLTYSGLSRFFIGREPFEFTIENIVLGVFHYKFFLPFWFLFNLICFVLIAPIFNMVMYNKITGICAIVFVWILNIKGKGLPESIFFDNTSIIYYMVGVYIGKFYFNDFIKRQEKRNVVMGSIVYGVLTIAYAYQRWNFGELPSKWESIYFSVWCLSAWIIFDIVVEKLQNCHFMRHSFWVFALHINVGAVMVKVLFFILPKEGVMAIVNYFLAVVITLFIIEMIATSIQKYLPQIYNLLSGER